VRLLARVIGIGIETADMLVREILSRKLRDRRAVCPNWARTDLCGGREVTRVPTATVVGARSE
jgi:hypothetical protein